MIGSLEVLIGLLRKFRSEQISIAILGAGIGSLNENDLRLAETFSGK